jgi:hypothetical protein
MSFGDVRFSTREIKNFVVGGDISFATFFAGDISFVVGDISFATFFVGDISFATFFVGDIVKVAILVGDIAISPFFKKKKPVTFAIFDSPCDF